MAPPTPHEPAALLYAVKRLELAIRAELDAMLADADVTTLQYTALTVLRQKDGISVAELARRSFVTPQAMADMTRPLERHGLIERVPNPDNRRELRVHLTEQGRRLLSRYQQAAEAIAARMTRDMDASAIAAFRSALGSAHLALTQN